MVEESVFQKDGYERLMKENQSLKEKRAFPEKLEELDRYRNQVLEYSKCITALRQSALVSVAIFVSHLIYTLNKLSFAEVTTVNKPIDSLRLN